MTSETKTQSPSGSREVERTAEQESTVSRTHPIGFLLIAFAGIGLTITSSYLSIFTTGSLAPETLIEYISYALLNVLVFPLSSAGVISSQPWWVWYILALQWFAIPLLAYELYLQFTGQLKRKHIDKIKPHLLFGNLWMVFAAGIASVIMVGLNWNIQQGAELLYAIGASFVSLPIAIFTPMMDFPPEIWALIVLTWIAHFKLSP